MARSTGACRCSTPRSGSTTPSCERGIARAARLGERGLRAQGTRADNSNRRAVLSILAEPPFPSAKVVSEGTPLCAGLPRSSTRRGRTSPAKTTPALGAKAAANYTNFPKVNLFTIDQVFGGWAKAQKTHFADGGVFDQIYTKK